MSHPASWLALGASAVLALVLLSGKKKNGQESPIRYQWESKNGKIQSLAEIPDEGEIVPFKLIKDNPVLPILLDGDNHLTCWILDSGYGVTAISSKLAKRLKLPAEGEIQVQTLKTDDLTSTTLPSGYVFDMSTNEPVLEIPAHTGVVRDLPSTLDKTYGSGAACLKQGGILGIPFLYHFVTKLNYKNKTLTFYDPSRFNYVPRDWNNPGTKFKGFLDGNKYFVIPMEIDGVTANMALDTGAFATIMTKGFLNKYKKETGREFDATGVDGYVEAAFSEHPIKLQKKIVPRAQIGDNMFRNFEVLFPDCNGLSTRTLCHFGTSLLK